MNVGIIFIGTSKYRKFFDGYYEGITKNFLPESKKHFFVFSDDIDDISFDKQNVTKIKIEHLSWPFITLFRFKFIKLVEAQLKKFDYLFFVDADLWCVNHVSVADIINDKCLIGVQHPGFIDLIGTFETNTRSNANIFDGNYDVSRYRQGCFWGGTSEDFIKMIVTLDKNVDDDLKNDIVAVWHDESHLNKYFLLHNDDVNTLHPGFAQPQNGYDFIRNTFPTKFVHLYKDLNEFPRFPGVK